MDRSLLKEKLEINESVALTFDKFEVQYILNTSDEDWSRLEELGITPECFIFAGGETVSCISGQFFYTTQQIYQWLPIAAKLLLKSQTEIKSVMDAVRHQLSLPAQ